MTFQKESNRSNFNEVIENGINICRYLDLVKKRDIERGILYTENMNTCKNCIGIRCIPLSVNEKDDIPADVRRKT